MTEMNHQIGCDLINWSMDVGKILFSSDMLEDGLDWFSDCWNPVSEQYWLLPVKCAIYPKWKMIIPEYT